MVFSTAKTENTLGKEIEKQNKKQKLSMSSILKTVFYIYKKKRTDMSGKEVFFMSRYFYLKLCKLKYKEKLLLV